MWYAVFCKKKSTSLSKENWSLVDYIEFPVLNGTHKCHCWLLAVRGNKMLQTSDWKPSLSKLQLPVKDVYSTSRLPTMEKLRRRPNDQFCTVLTLMWKQIVFQKTPLETSASCWSLQFLAVCHFPTWRLGGFRSSRGTMSIRKSNWSNFVMAMAMSFLWKHNRYRRSRDEVTLSLC